MKGIKDRNAFLFEINDGEMKYYTLDKEKGDEVFYLYPPESEHLFTIGYDIEIFKFDYKNKDFKNKFFTICIV